MPTVKAGLVLAVSLVEVDEAVRMHRVESFVGDSWMSSLFCCFGDLDPEGFDKYFETHDQQK